MICAYCGEDKKGTREHIISSGILDLFPECFLTIDRDKGKHYPADPVIKDVCAECNNNKISYIDSYSKIFVEKYFKKEYQPDEEIEVEYDLAMIQKILLKYAYNDLRARGQDTLFFNEDVREYLMNEKLNIPLDNVTVLGGLAINTTPAPLWLMGNLKIQWSPSPVFISNFIGRLDYHTGEIVQEKIEKEKLEGIQTAYIFRFNTGQFILVCWKDEEEEVERNKIVLKFQYPYKELGSEGIVKLKRCTGYLNYHMPNLIDTNWGLGLQDEIGYVYDYQKSEKTDLMKELNSNWNQEEKLLLKKYPRKK